MNGTGKPPGGGAEEFLSQYSEPVFYQAMKLREIVLADLPDIIEQVDIPARMVAYCYGQKYTDLICTIIPSKKGLKLGFNRGTEIPDPEGLLEGSGKFSRYVVIRPGKQMNTRAIKKLLSEALIVFKMHKSV